MSEIKISIIVPVYKVEKYIKRCMDSLINQSFDKYEIIVVNDGTPDNSMAYVEELREINDKIVICNRENGGLSAARNTGILQARGEYIWFCDSDDAIKQDCLQELYEEAHAHKLDMLLFDFEIIPEGEGMIERDPNYKGRQGVSGDVMTGMEMMRELVLRGVYAASACGYLIKRELLTGNNITFYEGILHEDELFTPIAISVAQAVKHRNWQVYKRYEHLGSITTSESCHKRMKGMAVVIKELTKFCDLLEKDWEKKVFESNIISLTKEFLGQTAKLIEKDSVLKSNVGEVRSIAKQKKWKLGLEFEAYVIYMKLRARLKI